MTDKEKIRREIEKRYEYWREKEHNSHSIESEIRMSECQHLLLLFNSLEEEPVNNTTLLYGLSNSIGIEEAVKETKEYKEWQGDPERQQSFIDFAKFGANYKHHTSKDMEEAACRYADGENPTCSCEECLIKTFKEGAQWQKEQDQSTIELAEDHAILAGMDKMEQQIMENAIECKVDWYDGFILDYTQEQQDFVLKKIGVKVGDKVKVLIIKQE